MNLLSIDFWMAVASLLIVPVKQLADVTFNYAGISSGAVEAERTYNATQSKGGVALQFAMK
ncbi:hypothetical protein EYF80_039379 [Liparis tanakae]|uniref:Uncharacterized protein n=1 Tax=Liparis tanakae TaxID=230148 RepID=A0A4Z2GBZ9_9TELE|nr:hypothetical protein EYF80_039379 [Liparis tanakae]